MRISVAAAFVATAAAFTARPLTGAAAGARRASPQLRAGDDIPEVVIGKARLALATKREVGDEDEIRQLWVTFKKCYPSKTLAVEAAEKNSNVFNPQLNSPTKISGTYKLLVQRFGKREAQSIIQRNPGVLICSPQSLKSESNESILRAADLIETLDANKGLIRLIARTTGLLIVSLVSYGVAVKNAAPGADMSPAGVLQQLIDANPYFKA